MKKQIVTACLYTVLTALVLGVGYPLLVTGIAQLTMRQKANGQLIVLNGQTIGSALIGQAFSGPGYFHSRPSAAGTGYDASSSSGQQLRAHQQGAGGPGCGQRQGGAGWRSRSGGSGNRPPRPDSIRI